MSKNELMLQYLGRQVAPDKNAIIEYNYKLKIKILQLRIELPAHGLIDWSGINTSMGRQSDVECKNIFFENRYKIVLKSRLKAEKYRKFMGFSAIQYSVHAGFQTIYNKGQ